MPIKNDSELQIAVSQASILLQEIQDYCSSLNPPNVTHPLAKIRFPRGYIRTAEFQRKRLSFISNTTLKSNLAYTLMLSDSISWLLFRTDISGMAAQMLRKLNIFLVGTLLESITQNYLKGKCSKSFKTRTTYLVNDGIISQTLKDDLDWVWDMRNRMHIFLLDGREYDFDYSLNDFLRTVKTIRSLLSSLI